MLSALGQRRNAEMKHFLQDNNFITFQTSGFIDELVLLMQDSNSYPARLVVCGLGVGRKVSNAALGRARRSSRFGRSDPTGSLVQDPGLELAMLAGRSLESTTYDDSKVDFFPDRGRKSSQTEKKVYRPWLSRELDVAWLNLYDDNVLQSPGKRPPRVPARPFKETILANAPARP